MVLVNRSKPQMWIIEDGHTFIESIRLKVTWDLIESSAVTG